MSNPPTNCTLWQPKDLNEAITKKKGPFRNNGWEGHALTHVCKKYARHADMKCPHGTPFTVGKSKTFDAILKHVKESMPGGMERQSSNGVSWWDNFFKVRH
jgi:hypothetical protein